MRKFFGIIELLMGLSLIILVIGSGLFLNFFGSSFFDIGNLADSTHASLMKTNLFILGFTGIGFGILFFVLGIMLIINGILDLRGE